jgi:hypothetical protein
MVYLYKSLDFYISELNYAETPASIKAHTDASAAINTRESDGGYVQYPQNLIIIQGVIKCSISKKILKDIYLTDLH